MSSDFVADTRISAAERTFGIAAAPAEAFVLGDDTALTHAHLTFGTCYKVIAGIASNQGDALVAGQKVHFLGKTEVPDTQALILYFSLPDGAPLTLRFVGLAPQQPDTRRYFRDAETILKPVLWDRSARGKQLIAARAVLLHLREQHGGTV